MDDVARLWFRVVWTYADGRIEYGFPSDEETAMHEYRRTDRLARWTTLQVSDDTGWHHVRSRSDLQVEQL